MNDDPQFLIGQRVRLSAKARGEDCPDEAHWIALAEYEPDADAILYGVVEAWPPRSHTEVQDGFLAADLTLWPD